MTAGASTWKMVSAVLVWQKSNYSSRDKIIFYALRLQVRTLFVSGLPVDIKPRELYLLFRPFKVSNMVYLEEVLKRAEHISQSVRQLFLRCWNWVTKS